MKYTLSLTKEAEASIEKLKTVLDVKSTDEVLSLCLGFVYQLMLLVAESEQVRRFVGMLGEKFKLEHSDHTKSN